MSGKYNGKYKVQTNTDGWYDVTITWVYDESLRKGVYQILEHTTGQDHTTIRISQVIKTWLTKGKLKSRSMVTKYIGEHKMV